MSDDVGELLRAHPLPDRAGGKDESGTVVILGGPPTCPGAVLLAGEAALRVGSGRVQLVVHPDVAGAVAVARREALVQTWDLRAAIPDDVARRVRAADAVLLGSGCNDLDDDVVTAVTDLVTGAPLVLDAGALGAAAAVAGDSRLVVAPNTPEARRLLGRDDDSGDDERTLALALWDQLGVPVAVRGASTVVADGDGARGFDPPPPGLGTPGSGDVYTGVLAALLAAGVAPVGALAWATVLHAKAAALLAESTPVGYLAGDIARRLPDALAVLG